jgi:hypothetical protein
VNEVSFRARPHHNVHTLGVDTGAHNNFWSSQTPTLLIKIYMGQEFVPTNKVNVSIPVPDPYPCPTIAPISDSFSPICAHACFYSQGCNQCKCMTWLNVTGHYSLHGNGCNLQTQIAIYNDLLWKFISNSYYFRKIYFLQVTSLHPKFYMPIFLWDVESSPNYTEKLIFAGIGTITLM